MDKVIVLAAENEAVLKEIRYDEKGLVPAIVQDEKTRQVLMLAYMNEEALRRTLSTGPVSYTHLDVYKRQAHAQWKEPMI